MTKPLPPGSTIGILGSGQLGRMLAMAAARLGLKTHIYCETSGPAFDVATHATKAAFTDADALARFAAQVDVVTYEFENVASETARLLQPLVPLRPNPRALEIAQDRLTEKAFISGLDIALAPFRAVASLDDLIAAQRDLGTDGILKTRRLGYDGKGQAPLGKGEAPGPAWESVGEAPCVLEGKVAFEREISVIVVRGVGGEIAYYDVPVNTHKGGILRKSVVPCGLPAADVAHAQAIAARIATALDYVGVLAVEMFHLGAHVPLAQRIAVNEIAPRVHNSGHWTIEACGISQFENQIRAVAGWPLGTTRRHADAVMLNLIGEEALAWQTLAAEPGAHLHLYGKNEARPGRKMGHVTYLSALTHSA